MSGFVLDNKETRVMKRMLRRDCLLCWHTDDNWAVHIFGDRRRRNLGVLDDHSVKRLMAAGYLKSIPEQTGVLKLSHLAKSILSCDKSPINKSQKQVLKRHFHDATIDAALRGAVNLSAIDRLMTEHNDSVWVESALSTIFKLKSDLAQVNASQSVTMNWDFSNIGKSVRDPSLHMECAIMTAKAKTRLDGLAQSLGDTAYSLLIKVIDDEMSLTRLSKYIGHTPKTSMRHLKESINILIEIYTQFA